MCDHRNSYIHASNGTIHQHEEEDMTAVMRWGFAVGQNELPAAYSGLFTGQVQRLLKYDRITKAQWLISIWNTRDGVKISAGLGGWESNKMAATFIQSHKKRRKRNLED